MSIELLCIAALAAGFFGSGHCFGMCGPIVILLEGQAATASLSRRLLYNVGRLSFYMLLGLVAGASGTVLTKIAGAELALQVLRVIAALLVIIIGLSLLIGTRLFSFLEKGAAVVWQKVSPLAKHVLPIRSPATALMAGFIWGALPCGLVYSSLALAAASGDALLGAVVMTVFWAGTLPALLLAGSSLHGLNRFVRTQWVRRIAGCLLVASGLVALSMPYLTDHQHDTNASEQHRHP